MKTFAPFLKALPDAQQKIWPSLSPVVPLGFVLYGGTAIALQLGHRVSIDFDFFKQEPLDKSMIYKKLPFCQEGKVFQDQPNALSLTHGGVKFSFFGDVNFGRVGTPLATEDRVLTVASLDDLMSTKLKVILQRSSVKDYQDIAAMIKAGVSLEKGLAAARQMFGKSFAPTESLRALVYFEDGDLGKLKKTEKNIIRDAVSKVSRVLPSVTLFQELTENRSEVGDQVSNEHNFDSGPRR
jgi:hypothetical protein